MKEIYGLPPKSMPKDLDFYVLSNEDIGLDAALIAGTNDVFSFALPYPASMDLHKESLVVHAIEFVKQKSRAYEGGLIMEALIAFLSMLNIPFPATFRGDAVDAVDEALKAQFESNIYFGQKAIGISQAASVESIMKIGDGVVDAIYYPPIPLDLITPLYIQLVNQTVTILPSSGAAANSSLANFEQVGLKVWFTTRKLTKAEMDARSMQINWSLLDS